jgi:conjugative relaxase-like TrwC/TraI family protein
VISIAKAYSADYYVGAGGGTGLSNGQGMESYYLDAVAGGEPPGVWAGAGAEHLGLTGVVEGEDMRTLYGRFEHPHTGDPVGSRPAQRASAEDRLAAALAAEPDALPERVAELRAQIERTDRQSVIGWDVTFSVPKSVTVAHTAAHRAELAAIRSGDTDRADRFGAIREGIEDAIHTADRAMIGYSESLATARTGGSGGAPTQWVRAPELTAATFFQTTSRNIDPQLHIHNVILNRAHCEDGKVRALDGADLLAQKHALGAIADRTLDEALTRMGFELQLRPDQMARELTVVPTEIAELFSSRSRQVTAKVADLAADAEERLGRELTDNELHRLKQTATLATRSGKDHDGETREELLERWWAETVAGVGTDLDSVADRIEQHLAGPGTDPGTLSPSAVLEEAVAAIGEKKAAWTRADLMLEIHLRLPFLGGLDAAQVQEALDDLTDQALTGDLVRQVSGLDDLNSDGDVAAEVGGPLANLARDPYTRPSDMLYAATWTIQAEEALRRSAIERGAHALDRQAVEAWIDTYASTIGADQRSAVAGLATSDARLAVLVGPAGTGKSYAAGTFAGLWSDLTDGQNGQVVGLTVSQIAAEVLRADGVEHTRNITQWLGVQDRLADGSTHPEHARWQLGPADVVLVDEASMVTTADLHRIQTLAESAGARVVLTGDPRQLGAVEAGGVMGLLDGHAETYTLSEVRRFTTDWEAAASLGLRDGSPGALAEYDRHGRLQAYDDAEQTWDAAARAAVADRLDGRSVVVVTGTNEQAAQVAGRVRAQLVELGLVAEHGVLLERDGSTAGIGDVITCRRNDYSLGVTNRGQYEVTGIEPDGALTVRPLDEQDDASTRRLPVQYVQDDVQLGYASTAHGAQGLTVDAAHLVTDGSLDAAGLYVGMSRGRTRNTAHVTVTPPEGELHEQVSGADPRPSARAVLADSLERDASNRAALVEAELDAQRLSSIPLLAGRLETVTRVACRERMDRHLDDLVTSGELDADLRARLGADQGAEHLSRLLRAVEQAGDDPREALRAAVTSRRGLGDADSVAQVLSHRITAGQPLPTPTLDDTAQLPGDIAPAAADHLRQVGKRIDARRDALAEQTAEQQPAWALDALGPLPADTAGTQVERADWLAKAGAIAAHREATGWSDEARAIGSMPGLSSTERRASYAAAWDALGQPEAGLDDAALSDGQLRVRVRARESELTWAPPHADDALRAAEHEAETARHEAVLARAAAEQATLAGEHDRADELLRAAEQHDAAHTERAAVAAGLDQTARARSAWAFAAAPTLDAGQRALAEAERRGLDLGDEPDRTTPEEWLDADRQARRQDDATRVITEADVIDDHDVAESSPDAHVENDTSSSTDQPLHWGGRTVVPEQITSSEVEAMTAATALVSAKIADRASHDTASADAGTEHSGYTDARRRREAADLRDYGNEAGDSTEQADHDVSDD